jgi:ABC-type branched-subunit amino acid transport system ATPase component
VFIAAGTRIAPALLRIQQGILIIRNSLGTAVSTIQLIRDLKEEPDNFSSTLLGTDEPFTPIVVLKNLSFQFPNANEQLLNNISLDIAEGSRVAIVGPSGSGKSTLVDIMLGIIPPTKGEATISNVLARDASREWPGKIGYVPQDVWLFDGTLRENILLGWQKSISDSDLEWVVQQSNLTEMLKDLPLGLNTVIGSSGQSLSGGQRQRIGIARALLTKPQLLVMDEATSSLDSSSESLITNAISNLQNDTTVIMIAHRLASIMSFERIIYLDQGQVLADGTFQEVRFAIPDFDRQADLLGL